MECADSGCSDTSLNLVRPGRQFQDQSAAQYVQPDRRPVTSVNSEKYLFPLLWSASARVRYPPAPEVRMGLRVRVWLLACAILLILMVPIAVVGNALATKDRKSVV